MKDKQWGYTTLPKYYEEYLRGSDPLLSTHVNIADYNTARLTPDSVALSEVVNIVWIFGGSTMQNTETIDELTIANSLASELNELLEPTHVKNLGEGSLYSSYELIKSQKLLDGVQINEIPTLVIF